MVEVSPMVEQIDNFVWIAGALLIVACGTWILVKNLRAGESVLQALKRWWCALWDAFWGLG